MPPEEPDDDHRDDDEPARAEKPNERQRQRRRGQSWPYDAFRFHQQVWANMEPFYRSLASRGIFLDQIRSAALSNHPATITGLTAATAAAQGLTVPAFPLQNWSSIVAATTWAKVSGSLRHLIDTNVAIAVPNVGAWVDSLRLDYYPSNWPADLRIRDVRNLADEEGIPLCWVPRAEVIDALRSADSASRRDVLLKHRDEVLDDCTVALGEVTAPELKQFDRAARKVVAAMRDGHDEPAQALAMNTIDATLRGTLFDDMPQFRYKPVVLRIEESRDCLLKDFRQSATLWPLLRLFKNFSPGSGGIPSQANRHATAHTVDEVQYTPVNALIATMLAVSVLREVQESLLLGQLESPAEELDVEPGGPPQAVE